MSNAGRQLPQEDESAPEWETETLDPEVQARSDRPTDVAAAEQLPSPDLDLQNPGTDFRRDAFELQQTDDVTTREDSAQALVRHVSSVHQLAAVLLSWRLMQCRPHSMLCFAMLAALAASRSRRARARFVVAMQAARLDVSRLPCPVRQAETTASQAGM